ncbi:L-rhamnose mutarotase [Acrocarpospora macrocephala]|uniref:L-rhamnose mutarotase n=2 Tax=Acrocarpospora TaxID=90974 RepID=A0A5M3XF46_9ACTN|nr:MULTISPECIES: L-rhamnose mutarotase [Acrocarpospora]GES13302.1 hypothetical protein Amac_068990 [Acrocarpospora macrocephala]GES20227.1 hypothetical protein Aple_031230 [Acrocarpospora pleiomorpha]
MQRIALRTRLKPGCEEIYDREHASIPPELEAELRAFGVHSWRIWRSGREIFHYVEVDDYAILQAKLRDSTVNQAWQAQMNRLLDGDFDPDDGGLRKVWEMS